MLQLRFMQTINDDIRYRDDELAASLYAAREAVSASKLDSGADA